jgi:FHA domain
MAASPEQPSLTVLGGPLSGQRLVFDNTVVGAVIGSDASCSFRIDAPGVSPIHARVRYEDGNLLVFDTQSPRGLYINDDRVESQATLRNGDILWLGKPGEEGVLMIQCRIPSRPSTAATSEAASAPAPLPTVGINASSPAVVLDADMVDTIIEPNVEPSFEPSSGADAFFGDTDVNASDPNIETRAIPPSERRHSSEEEDLPRTLHVERPPRVAAPSDFEDETVDAPEPEEPEELPPTVINVLPATVIAPPPPRDMPPPAPPALAPPARPAARPTPAPAASPSPRPSSPKAKGPSERAGAPSPRPPRSGGGGGMVGKIIAGAGALLVVVLGTAGFLFWKSRSTPGVPPRGVPAAATVTAAAPTAEVVTTTTTGATEPVPTPAPVVSAPAPIEEVVTVVNKTSTPAPRASQVAARPQVQPSLKPRPAGGSASAAPPTAPPAAAQAAALKAQAEAAFAAGQYDAAVAHYDEAQRLSPSDDLLVGKTRAQVARDSMRRRFNAGVTTASGGKAGGSISGFESSDVKVAKALDYSGRLDYEVTPEHVRPGVAYTIKVSLTNDGKKKWQVGNSAATAVMNGQKAPVTLTSSVREIEPQQKLPLGEITGTWPEGVNSWYLEVVVSSNRGDSFKSLLTWK